MMYLDRFRIRLVAAAVCLLLGGTASAQSILYVDDDADPGGDCTTWENACPDLQTAVTAAGAVPGAVDQIWVAAGTYAGNFILALEVELYGGFDGTETDLAARDWTTNLTILDGNQSGSVVTVPSGATEPTRIDGFTITNGSADYGAGLYLDSSSPVIANNTITGNSTPYHGGGLYLLGSSPTITNNTITGNGAHLGGGLYLSGSSSPTITDNAIMGNSATYHGGGLFLDSSSPAISNNTITGNSATYHGGGLYLDSSSAEIASNTITGNSAQAGGGLSLANSSPTIADNTITGNGAGDGGGLYMYSGSPTIANNRITGNSADDGGGLHVRDSSPTIANNTITGNGAGDGGGLYLTFHSSPTIANNIAAFNSSGVYQSSTSESPTFRHNCVYGNVEYDFDGIGDPAGTDGNISADPQLAGSQYGDVHIQPDSPCVDAGSNTDAYGDYDMDGQPRIQPLDGAVDIGADESDGTVWPAGPYAIVRVSPAGDDANDGSSWALAKRTVQAGIDAASEVGGEVWVQAGTYEERITLRLHAYVYGGFAGGETMREERDWVTNVTTLDGQGEGSVVTARPGYRVSAIDGFTITNGIAEDGGGLYLEYSSPTIANNTITGNGADYGGGLYLWYSLPTISNNTIMGNGAAWSGGGLCLADWSSPTITNNLITGNGANSGGALYLAKYASPTIANNTITGNGATSGGGGLYLARFSSPTITNNILTFNSSGVYRYSTGGTPTFRHNCVYGNTEYDFDGIGDPAGIDGNISADPQLAGTQYGDVHIQPDSPCVDAGSNTDAYGDYDMDGQPRIQPLDGAVDIGADESDGTVWPNGPYVIVRISSEGDDTNDGSSWGLAKRTVQAGIDAASGLGGEVWVQGGTYEERITLRHQAYVYGGFAGWETMREERDWVTNVTTLDGQGEGSAVTARPGYRVSAIDGFTITNGIAEDGGGLYLEYSSPTIANNTITGNSVYGGYLHGGGGLCLLSSSPMIADNMIAGNSVSGESPLDVMQVEVHNGEAVFTFPQETDLDYTSSHSNREWTNLGTLMSETITFAFTSGNTYVVDVFYFPSTTGAIGGVSIDGTATINGRAYDIFDLAS